MESHCINTCEASGQQRKPRKSVQCWQRNCGTGRRNAWRVAEVYRKFAPKEFSMTKYAAQTSVPVSKSKAEIEAIVERYGCVFTPDSEVSIRSDGSAGVINRYVDSTTPIGDSHDKSE